jgi:adenine-specific DNA-methyltransferase
MGRAGAKLARLSNDFELEAAADGAGAASLIESLRAGGLDRCDDPEARYREIVPAARRRRLSQYFTPPDIARLMTRWIAAIAPRSVLDPAVGPGVFLRSVRRACPEAGITAVDVDPVALAAARGALGDAERVRFVESDFLTWEDRREFDACVANPPYLRHHDMAYAFDIHDAIGGRNGIALSRLTNLYVLFILEICRRLRAGGRAAIVVPGEWMNANFGAPLKGWLLGRGWLHTIVCYSHASTVFEDALTTASVLFIEKHAGARRDSGVRSIYVRDGAPCDAVEAAVFGARAADARLFVQRLDADVLITLSKWEDALAHGVRDQLAGFTRLGTLASTRRGIATGANRFFHLRPSEVRRIGVRDASTRACVGRAADVRGRIFTADDLRTLEAADVRCRLLDVRGRPSARERTYLARGERDGIASRYLCAARGPHWYRMEPRPPAPVWAGVFARSGLRFVWNAASVANHTAFHCIYPHVDDALFAAALAACLNSTVVQEQARQHMRVYGAGLAKIEPRDLLEIPVPDLRVATKGTLKELRDALLALDRAQRRNRRNDTGVLDDAVRKAAAAAQRG